jgi:hypothetical protein
MRTLTTFTALAVLACLPVAAAAQQTAPATLAVHKQSDIAYVSGGSSPEEERELQRVANKYPMQLRFIVGDDPRAGRGVRVVVKDLRGNTLIDAVSEGPVFYFNPPSGRWTVDAEYQGETVSKTVDLIGRRYIGLQFEFKGSSG